MDTLLDHELLDRAVQAAEKLERGESPDAAGAKVVADCWRMWMRIMHHSRELRSARW